MEKMEGQLITKKLEKKKKRCTTTNNHQESVGEDRLSSLSDDLIHHILSFSDMKLAVQTSLLSKRWKLLWTSVPFLNIKDFKLGENFLSHRNHAYNILKFRMRVFDDQPWFLYRNFVDYAISHNVQHLEVYFLCYNPIELSTFSSCCIKKLRLMLYFGNVLESDHCWDLPALTTLHLYQLERMTLPESYLNCLSSLESLYLNNLNLPDAVTLLSLKTFSLIRCNVPSKAWDLPALLTLTLRVVEFPKENANGFLRGLVNLQNLTLSFEECIMNDWVIDCPQLVNLEINDKAITTNTHLAKILVTSRRIRNFSSFGFFPISFEVSELENVNIKLCDGSGYRAIKLSETSKLTKNVKKYFGRITDMFRGLCKTRILTLDLGTIKKICNISSFGFFSIAFEVSELENVKIHNGIVIGYMSIKPIKNMKKYFGRVCHMFRGLCNARILTLDLETIKALSSILGFLVHSPPPFYHLKYVKVPQGYKESSMSPYLKLYLLGNSPKATIVTTLPQETMIPRTVAASVRAQNVVIEEPLEAPSKVFIDSENSNEIVCVDTVDMGVQEEHVVQNSEVHDDRIIRCVGAPVKEIVNDRVSSSGKKSDIGLWHGHEVKSEFVCLLDHIMNKYPETFDHFATKNKELCTMKLNMLCTTVNNFTKIPMTEVDSEIITEYMDLFDGLKKFGFNISWLVSRLNYIEHFRFSQPLLSELHAIDCHIDDAKRSLEDLQFRIVDTKTKLQNLQTLRAEKMEEIQKAFGTMGTSLAVGYIGDDLLPGP